MNFIKLCSQRGIAARLFSVHLNIFSDQRAVLWSAGHSICGYGELLYSFERAQSCRHGSIRAIKMQLPLPHGLRSTHFLSALL